MAATEQAAFDPYTAWLMIPAGQRPPDHYTLLGLSRHEADPAQIRTAARERMKQVRPRCLKHPDEGTRLLNEIAAAQVCLLDPQRRAAYRQTLVARPNEAAGTAEAGLLPLDTRDAARPANEAVASDKSYGSQRQEGEVLGPAAAGTSRPSWIYAVQWQDGDAIPLAVRPGMGWPVGISLGQAAYVVAYVAEDGQIQPFGPAGSGPQVPPVIALSPQGVLVGEAALAPELTGKVKVIRDFHRRLGEAGVVGQEEQMPEVLSARVLRLPLEAMEQACMDVATAVIAIPRFFNEAQRGAVQRISQCVGLCQVQVIEDPIALALAFADRCRKGGEALSDNLLRAVYAEDVILVIDVDDETFEATVLKLNQQGAFEVLASAGTEDLGGRHWNDVFLDMVCAAYQEETGKDLRVDARRQRLVRLKVWSAQTRLAKKSQTTVSLPYGKETLDLTFDRADYEDATKHLRRRLKEIVDRMFMRAHLGLKRIDGVLLAGETTRMTAVRQLLKDMIPRDVELLDAPELGKARGAAVQGILRQVRQGG